jgi:hypothetical protein
MKNGEGYKAFIDPDGYRSAIAGWEQQFKNTVAEEAKAQ